MSRLVRASDLIGMPVMALDEARIIGEVRDVLFDPRQARVVGLTLRGKGLLSSPMLGLLPAEAIRAAGNDAVMVESESVLLRNDEEVSKRLPERHEAPGTHVVTEDGVEVGVVSDVVLEVIDDRIEVVGYCIERDQGRELIIPAPDGPGEWTEQVVLPRGSEQRSTEGLVGFSAELERMRRDRSGPARASARSA